MFLHQHRAAYGDNFSYLFGAEGEAAVVDPAGDARPLQKLAAGKGLKIVAVLFTHSHPDHTGDAARLCRETGAKIAAHPLARPEPAVPLKDGDILKVGPLDVAAIATPGHSPDSMCYYLIPESRIEERQSKIQNPKSKIEERQSKIQNPKSKILFTGDTLFVGECGRCDLPGSDPAAMHDSLFGKLCKLPDDTVILPGHDYGPRPRSTLGEEKRGNYTLKPRTLEEFVRFVLEA